MMRRNIKSLAFAAAVGSMAVTSAAGLDTNQHHRSHHLRASNSNTKLTVGDRQLSESVCGERSDSICSDNTNCTSIDTDGLLETWTGDSISCLELGFDFGWKTKVAGCVDIVSAFDDVEQMALTSSDCSCATGDPGKFALHCRDNATLANVAATTDVQVLVSGDGGGNLYSIPKAVEYDGMQTPSGKPILHLEFCFTCPSSSESEEDGIDGDSLVEGKDGEVAVAAVATKAPGTGAPAVTKAPTDPATDAPTTKAPTDSPTSGPTLAPITLPPTLAPSTLAPSACDTCKAAPEFTKVPEAKMVCPGEYAAPLATDVSVEDACGNDLAGILETFQTTEFENNNTCLGLVRNAWGVEQGGCDVAMPVVVTQIITFEDMEAPKFADSVLPDIVHVCPSEFSLGGLAIPFASDNCQPVAAVVPSVISGNGNGTSCEDLTVSFVASDVCGNDASIEQTIKFSDNLKPTLKSQAPRELILQCTDPMPVAEVLLFSDNCNPDMTVTASDSDSTGSYCTGNITTRTWKGAEDACGNAADDVTQEIKVMDQSPPVLPATMVDVELVCPADLVVNDLDLPNATDDCSSGDAISVTASASALNGCADVSVIFTAEDQCGKTSSTHQRVKFTDTLPHAPLNGTVPVDVTLTCRDPMPRPATVIFVDNCSEDIDVVSVDEDAGGNICHGKTTVRTWNGPTDNCGNAAESVTQSILVLDDEAPVLPESMSEVKFLCPSDFVLSELTLPTSTDDCDPDVIVTSSATTVDGCKNVTVTYTATDSCEKQSTVNQTVMFTDKDPPQLIGVAPTNTQLKCGDAIPDQPKLSFSDNCAEDITVSGMEAGPVGSVCEGRTIQRTWVGPMDECYNKASDILQNITTFDMDAPELPPTLPGLSFTCTAEFKVDELVPPSATDDCSTDVMVTPKVETAKKCDAHMITWTAMDDCNRTAEVTQTVQFTDSVAPSVVGSTPAAITVACGAFPEEAKLVFWDYCAGDQEVFSIDSLPTGDVCTGQTFTRTWEGPSDECLNTADAVTQIITVKDMGPPVLPDTLPDIELVCHSDFDSHALEKPNATDDCESHVEVEKTVPPIDTCANLFDVVWTAIDGCSNTDSVPQTVRFSGVAVPTIACPVGAVLAGGGGAFEHVVTYGDCYTATDFTFTYETTCAGADGAGCQASIELDGPVMTITGAPEGAKVDWLVKVDYGCGVAMANCSVQ